MEPKFKVGDKVINLKDMYLWNNSYHFKRFMQNAISVVEHITEHQFSTSKDITLLEPVSEKSWSSMDVYSQANGMCLGDQSVVYHLVHDRHLIEKFLNNAFETAQRNLDIDDANKLHDIEKQIEALQKQAALIRNKESEPNKFSARRFTDERITEMKKLFLV